MDWHRTIRANLKHYQPECRTIIPETRIGYGRKRSLLREIILCVDQSGSMAASVVSRASSGRSSPRYRRSRRTLSLSIRRSSISPKSCMTR